MKRQLRDRLARATGPGRARQFFSRWSPNAARERLDARLTALEAEAQESRRLQRRLAELTDVVQELLLPISQRDEDKVRELLRRYSSSL